MRTAFLLFICLGFSLCFSIGISRADDSTAPATNSVEPAAVTAKAEAIPAPITKPELPPPVAKSDAVPPPPAAATEPKEVRGDEDQSAREAREEYAEAQRMADAALAAQSNSSSTSQASAPPIETLGPSSPANGSSTRTHAAVHHGMQEMAHPNLGPDYADPKHHTMGELF